MTQIQTLSELQPGQSATVRSACAPDGMQRRLRDLGLIENTRVVCLGRSPMGDPSAYLIRGTVIALRRCDCCGIRVAVPERGCAHGTDAPLCRRARGRVRRHTPGG